MARRQWKAAQLHSDFYILSDDFLAFVFWQDGVGIPKKLRLRTLGETMVSALAPSEEIVIVSHNPTQASIEAAGAIFFGRLSHTGFSQALIPSPRMRLWPHCVQSPGAFLPRAPGNGLAGGQGGKPPTRSTFFFIDRLFISGKQ
jgi:hypothetical protein